MVETRLHHHLPDSTPVCAEPHHEDPCTLPCPGCEADCEPRFRSTLGHVRRRVELDRELQELAETCTCGHNQFHHPAPGTVCTQDGCECRRFDPCAVVIQVEDLGKALEAREFGTSVASAATHGFLPVNNDLRWALGQNVAHMSGSESFVKYAATRTAHLARLALGESS